MSIAPLQNVQAGATIVGKGFKSAFNISTTTVLKTIKGRVCVINVLVAGSEEGAVFDSAVNSGLGLSNMVTLIPKDIGTYTIDCPCNTGIVIQPPTGGTVYVNYN